ncbi:hypothetical protein [Rhodococcus sp. Q]|uniref:hypothetical protein n=1 Tax=Rhodococcus sp. Q TaxID=2502252 RepID=UPI0010F86490|nr:hypothetical protein [Rhodococcus sp. Q]
MRKVVTAAVVAVGVCVVGTACQAQTKADESAPVNAWTVPTTSTSTAVSVPTVPVELSGTEDSVLTANLEPGGYTVQYTSASGHLIVKPVNRDGSTGSSFINASNGSGVVAYGSTGPVTLQIGNTRGPWTLRFVPLA